MSTQELERLENASELYAKGDRFDEMIVDRCVELIKRFCRTKKNLLEVGCGNGYSTTLLSEVFENLEVLEGSASNLRMAEDRVGRNLTCHNALLEDFITEKKYDNIALLHILEHVENPVKALEHLSGLLTDDGLIYISVPNAMSLNRRAGYEMGLLPGYDTLAPKDYAVGHRRLYTVEMLTDHLERSNLSLVDVKGVYLKPLSESQMIQLGEEAIKAFYRLGEDVPQYCAGIFAVAKKAY